MEPSTRSCWSCGASHDEAMNCAKCGSLQAPQEGLNSFQVLGLPVRVLVDEDELSTRHLELTRALHPDFYGDASPTEQAQSLAWSSQVNDAHQISSRWIAEGDRSDCFTLSIRPPRFST